MAEYRFEDIAINSTEKKKPVESDKEHYLGLEHLDSGTFKVSRFGSEVAPIGDKLIMKKGDVLFGKRRAYQKKVAIAPFDGIFSAHGMVLRPKEDVIDKDFFPLFIASDYFLDAAIKISVGSLSPTINWRDLKELKFNLPELDEQKKLAEVLWQIVDTMESYKKLLAKTDELVKAKFVEMFGDDNLTKVNIKDVTEKILAGGDKPKDISEIQTTEYRYPVISNGEGPSGITCYSKNYTVDRKALTIAARGAIGYTSIREAFFTPIVRLIVIIPNERINLTYLKFVIDDLKICGIGSSQKQLTIPEVSKIAVLLPPIELQNQFANFVQKSEESKAAIQSSLDSLSAVYKKIIAENLGGSN